MENKKYKITLSNGTIIRNLTLNGNTFISKKIIDPSIFENNTYNVVINDGETDETHRYMEYVPTAQPVEEEFWFSLRDVSEQELFLKQLRADTDFLLLLKEKEVLE